MLLNNMHLGMVVQWEDRFHAANRAHTYLGPIDDPEAIGQGNGITPEHRYPDFVAIARGFHWNGRQVSRKAELAEAIQEMIDSPGPYLLGRASALPGARAADDPGGDDGAGFDQGVTSPFAPRKQRPQLTPLSWGERATADTKAICVKVREFVEGVFCFNGYGTEPGLS